MDNYKEEMRAIKMALSEDFESYSESCLKIRTKSGDGGISPFILNKAQKYIHFLVENQLREKKKVRAIILKGRQQGCSTYVEARFFWKVTHKFGVRAFILTHEEEATNNLFDIAKRYYENCPAWMKPDLQASNAKELIFNSIDSGYKLGTAGNKSTGRSQTVQFLHASEAAFYKHADEHAKGIMQTVGIGAGTEIFIESTANGVGNWFHQQWQAAEAGLSDFIPIFIPWFWQDEYCIETPANFSLEEGEKELKDNYNLTDGQIAWRRLKISELSVNGVDGSKSFKQEYPCNPAEAFQLSGEDSFITPESVSIAREVFALNNLEKIGPLLIGVDPARFGDDRTAIIRRQGRVAFNLQTYTKKDTMEISGIVHNIILNENPARVFVDVGGLGAGVYDRLKELGHGSVIYPVNSAEAAIDQNAYSNKRAEMWALMKQWLLDTPVCIPNLDSLHSDLCSSKYKVDSKGRILIESKADMKKRGVRSSDEADALGLTFAMPVSFIFKSEEQKKKDSEIAKDLMSPLVSKLRNQAYRYK